MLDHVFGVLDRVVFVEEFRADNADARFSEVLQHSFDPIARYHGDIVVEQEQIGAASMPDAEIGFG